MCTTFSHNFKDITQNGQNQSCDTIALKRRDCCRTMYPNPLFLTLLTTVCRVPLFPPQGNATSMGSRGVPHVTSAPPSSSSATSSPILVRSLGGGGGGAPAGGPVVVPPGTPSPLSTAGASPYLWPAAGGCSTTPLVRPTLVHADNFYVSTAPAPQAVSVCG